MKTELQSALTPRPEEQGDRYPGIGEHPNRLEDRTRQDNYEVPSRDSQGLAASGRIFWLYSHVKYLSLAPGRSFGELLNKSWQPIDDGQSTEQLLNITGVGQHYEGISNKFVGIRVVHADLKVALFNYNWGVT